MNWDAVGALGEWIGALGVIISIAFLALQVRSNTRTLKARAAYDANNSWSALNEQLSLAVFFESGTRDPKFAEEAFRVLAKDANPEDFTAAQLYPHAMIWRSLLQKLEAQYWLSRHGLLETKHWEIKACYFVGFLQLPVPKAWWEVEQQGIYSAEFRSALSAMEPPTVFVGRDGSQALPRQVIR